MYTGKHKIVLSPEATELKLHEAIPKASLYSKVNYNANLIAVLHRILTVKVGALIRKEWHLCRCMVWCCLEVWQDSKEGKCFKSSNADDLLHPKKYSLPTWVENASGTPPYPLLCCSSWVWQRELIWFPLWSKPISIITPGHLYPSTCFMEEVWR